MNSLVLWASEKIILLLGTSVFLWGFKVGCSLKKYSTMHIPSFSLIISFTVLFKIMQIFRFFVAPHKILFFVRLRGGVVPIVHFKP